MINTFKRGYGRDLGCRDSDCASDEEKQQVKVCPVCKQLTALRVLDSSQQETLRKFGMATLQDKGIECERCRLVFNISGLVPMNVSKSEVERFRVEFNKKFKI